jgi:hypothetical protein
MRSLTTRQVGKLFGLILLALALGLAQAQAKPNFSGTWKMNAAKSEFGPMPAPDSRTDKISHADPSLKDTVTQSGQQGEMTSDLSYSTDGKETTNTIRGNEFKSTVKWDGDELVIDNKGSFNGQDVTLSDRWSLSEDGKTITIKRHAVSPMGEMDQKILLEKQ